MVDPSSGEEVNIPHREKVKYLGFISIINLVHNNQQISIQFEKATKAFRYLVRLFHKKLSRKAEIISSFASLSHHYLCCTHVV